ncbi:Hint domain-containing protein [Shimia abyssi]|uniref:Hint domain-containing protein n=1 Tax=Shimia abyssi TaxID=1662395 RepID=A0A2P8FFA8_9RHOB|nr:Hint domain-containing protein [Shimia abyssi]PSL20402.1 Hint domain-containing protein [Shimia abyssi]
MSTQQTNSNPSQSLPVYPASMLKVTDGANLGDELSFADDMVPDDIYSLTVDADVVPFSFSADKNGQLHTASESAVGTPGARVFLDCVATFMPPSGDTIEVLILVEVDEDGNVANIFGAPLAPLYPKTNYVLVGTDQQTAKHRLAQLACVSFTRGTCITMATGEQKPVESLSAGDLVLTRDDGPQEIRWIGTSTQRAVGVFAPIRISAGTLNNAGDLMVSPDHRLFIYQRHDHIGAGRSELMVKARHLVNDDTVQVQDGGFVDYFQLMFDSHQIIFAEGISAETMQIDMRTQAVLPADLQKRMSEPMPGHQRRRHHEYEVHKSLLDRPDAAALLKRASSK